MADIATGQAFAGRKAVALNGHGESAGVGGGRGGIAACFAALALSAPRLFAALPEC